MSIFDDDNTVPQRLPRVCENQAGEPIHYMPLTSDPVPKYRTVPTTGICGTLSIRYVPRLPTDVYGASTSEAKE